MSDSSRLDGYRDTSFNQSGRRPQGCRRTARFARHSAPATATIPAVTRRRAAGRPTTAASHESRSHFSSDQSHSGSAESWFEPRRGNFRGPVVDVAAGLLLYAPSASSAGSHARSPTFFNDAPVDAALDPEPVRDRVPALLRANRSRLDDRWGVRDLAVSCQRSLRITLRLSLRICHG